VSTRRDSRGISRPTCTGSHRRSLEKHRYQHQTLAGTHFVIPDLVNPGRLSAIPDEIAAVRSPHRNAVTRSPVGAPFRSCCVWANERSDVAATADCCEAELLLGWSDRRLLAAGRSRGLACGLGRWCSGFWRCSGRDGGLNRESGSSPGVSPMYLPSLEHRRPCYGHRFANGLHDPFEATIIVGGALGCPQDALAARRATPPALWPLPMPPPGRSSGQRPPHSAAAPVPVVLAEPGRLVGPSFSGDPSPSRSYPGATPCPSPFPCRRVTAPPPSP
jgi:hypothetical protein